MEVKLLRLFGFEVNPYVEGEKRHKGLEEGNEKSLDTTSSMMVNTAKEKSSGHETERKKYRCQFCQREFTNPQAMGGHQNAHKKERRKKRRMRHQEKSNSSNSHFGPPQSQYALVYHNYLPWFNAFSLGVPNFSCYGECQISFNPSRQNQNLQCGAPNLSKSISLASQNCKPDASSAVVRP